MTTLSDLVRLQEEATPGPWKTRGGSADGRGPMFVQAPRLHADDAYDIEVLGEDMHPDHYPEEQQEKDCAFVAAARNFDLRQLATQYEAMREWIANKKYVTHLNECYSYNEEGEGTPITCTCGLSSLDTKARGDE